MSNYLVKPFKNFPLWIVFATVLRTDFSRGHIPPMGGRKLRPGAIYTYEIKHLRTCLFCDYFKTSVTNNSPSQDSNHPDRWSFSLYIVDKARYGWTGGSAVDVNIENKRLTVVRAICRQKIRKGNFTLLFGRPRVRNAQSAGCTCSTIRIC